MQDKGNDYIESVLMSSHLIQNAYFIARIPYVFHWNPYPWLKDLTRGWTILPVASFYKLYYAIVTRG